MIFNFGGTVGRLVGRIKKVVRPTTNLLHTNH